MSEIVIFIFHELNVPPYAFIPELRIAFIDAVDLAPHRRPNIFVGKQKLTKARIERETVYPVPGRVDHHRARPINEIARSDLVDAFLKAIFDSTVRRMVCNPLMNREYGS